MWNADLSLHVFSLSLSCVALFHGAYNCLNVACGSLAVCLMTPGSADSVRDLTMTEFVDHDNRCVVSV